ncbi:ATP-binding protein [uncultured Capnocytophaga sp.]|uniref:ATP-binding protein n=1 Tax=uncultured Capnocytophaga sp. TaxID=159273 RepID=UPI002617C977|nr:ATP-binding protein [uncultured Capnocytophaga sp.]
MESNELFFSVKAGIKNIVGKDLIADDNIAIFELVKNSYDAYASKVIITFEDNKIIIADDGKGMSIDDIEKKWLALAYSAKKNGDEDNGIDQTFLERRKSYRDHIQEKRKYAGAKGIGRFSCDRLGEELLLSTKKINTNTIEQLKIDWKDFEKQDNIDFSEIKITHNSFNEDETSIAFPNNAKSGTILEITKTSLWDRAKILSLKHSLEKLINPFSDDNDFSIEIICNGELTNDKEEELEREKVNGIIQNSILDIIKLKTTKVEVKVDSNKVITKIIDRGILIYHISEENKNSSLIDNLEINLFFLNRSAKINFKKRMNLDAVNYGSIFLFKNGFRVQPYGNMGDDSWGLDFRAQQGYNRFLGTRNLFGQVSIFTDNTEEFKEVSNREGGLVETIGFKLLKDIFEKAHRRLERYVVGVLWGEGFKRNKYFKLEDEVDKQRELLKEDNDKDDFEIVKNNIGSQLDFIQILKGLANDKDIEIIDYNKELVQEINNRADLDILQPKFLKDLDKISDKLSDPKLRKVYNQVEINFKKSEEKRRIAELKAIEEEEKRIAAEQAKKEAEKKAYDAELKKEKAEKDKLKAELERYKAEEKAKEAEQEKEKAKDNLATEKRINAFKSALIGIDKEKIIGLQHQIFHSSSRINRNIQLLIKHLGGTNIDNIAKKYISVIALESSKVSSITSFITKANFNLTATEIKTDIVAFIKDYINEIYLSEDKIIDSKIKIDIVDNDNSIIKKIVPLEITTLIDNFINNAEKANASKIIFEFIKSFSNLIILVKDNGKGISSDILDRVFELGFTTTNGSGIGLFQNKEVISNLKGNISVKSNINSKETIFEINIPL